MNIIKSKSFPLSLTALLSTATLALPCPEGEIYTPGPPAVRACFFINHDTGWKKSVAMNAAAKFEIKQVCGERPKLEQLLVDNQVSANGDALQWLEELNNENELKAGCVKVPTIVWQDDKSAKRVLPPWRLEVQIFPKLKNEIRLKLSELEDSFVAYSNTRPAKPLPDGTATGAVLEAVSGFVTTARSGIRPVPESMLTEAMLDMEVLTELINTAVNQELSSEQIESLRSFNTSVVGRAKLVKETFGDSDPKTLGAAAMTIELRVEDENGNPYEARVMSALTHHLRYRPERTTPTFHGLSSPAVVRLSKGRRSVYLEDPTKPGQRLDSCRTYDASDFGPALVDKLVISAGCDNE